MYLRTSTLHKEDTTIKNAEINTDTPADQVTLVIVSHKVNSRQLVHK